MSISSCQKHFGRQSAGWIALVLLLGSFFSERAAAQGLPVEMGSHVPVWLWFIGAAVLGLAIAYGIMSNSRRSASEKAITERATKDLYAKEDRENRA